MYKLTYKPVTDLTPEDVQRLKAIAAPHYEDASLVLDRDLRHCTNIYLIRSEHEIIAFFMVAWEKLTVEKREYSALFLGLTCADRTYAVSKINAVFIQCVVDISEWKELNAGPLFIWCTTATPIVLKIVPKFWNLIAPDTMGTYHEQYVPIADAIRKTYFGHEQSSNHPFVLKGVATGTRYSSEEWTYMDAVARKINISVFEQLGIDERLGDRLLMLMDVPDAEKLTRLKKELADMLKIPSTS